MVKKLTFLSIVILWATSGFAQNNSDSIVIKSGFWGNKYLSNGNTLSIQQLENKLSSNPDAIVYFNKAKSTEAITYILSAAGGALIGWPIGTAIGGGKPNWVLAGIGAGLIVIDIPLVKSAEKKLKKAVDTYNSGLSPKPHSQSYDVHLGIVPAGLALVINF